MSAPITDKFPDEIALEILTRLPAKEIHQFKLVSKRAHTLITQPQFITSFLLRNPPTWTPLGKIITISYSSPHPIEFNFDRNYHTHTLSINPKLLLKPTESVTRPEIIQFPALVLVVSNGLVLFCVNISSKNGDSEDVLFVTNPISAHCARLPSYPTRINEMQIYGLITREKTGEIVVAAYDFTGHYTGCSNSAARLNFYSSETGEWVVKKANYPVELESQSWYPFLVFEVGERLYLADVSAGIMKCEVDEGEEVVVSEFIPLPHGWTPRTEEILGRRWVGPGSGRGIQYVEMREEVGLEVWRRLDREWELVYRVPRLDIERSLGCGFKVIGVPNVFDVDPLDADTFVLYNIGSDRHERMFTVNARTSVVGSRRDGDSMAVSFVIPCWPTPLPPRLYADYSREQGNVYFKGQEFMKAIKCYSKSIVLLPSATAYANRAMAYLKVRSFREAEDDCTEALNLDGGYCKVYVRRALARKDLQNLGGALEDLTLALSLEPDNREVKKLYAEIKTLHEKAFIGEEGASH